MEKSGSNLVYPGNESHNIENQLVCVNFPGKVENVDKAVECLGGYDELSNVLGSTKPGGKKLELRFRPRNIFCHKINGERSNVAGLLVKVRAKKKTQKIVGVTIAGIIDTEYSFNGMADFAYLPAQKGAEGVTRSIYKDIVPDNEIMDSSYLTERKEEPLFLPPPQFSRTELSHIDVFRRDTVEHKGDDNIIRTNRSQRKVFGTIITFSMDGEIPQRAIADAYDSVKLKLVSPEKMQSLRDLFQQRPIWIKSGLLEASGLSPETVRIVLPILAFYYTTGPWRTCWVRFGYDPRKDFGSRFYQTIDYRVRKYADIKEATERKAGRGKNRKFGSSKFDENTIPRFNFIFYQYCDINVQQIRDMLAKVPMPVAGAVCDETRGWLPVGLCEQAREIMNEIVHRNYRNLSVREDSSTGNDAADEFDYSDENDEDDDDDDDLDSDYKS